MGLNRAVLVVFRDHGPREARNKARLKVLLGNWGIPRFRAAVEERFGRPLLPAGRDETMKHGGDHVGVHRQRQPGLWYVGLLVPVGRVSGTHLKELARLAQLYGTGEIRLTADQNVIITNIPEERLPLLLREPLLRELTPSPSAIMRGLVCCTGTDYCHFSLMDTKGEALKLAHALERKVTPDRPVRIHISGCPNACGQHHIGDISLLAVKVKRGGNVVEAADVALGGHLGPDARLAVAAFDGVALAELPDVLAGVLNDHTIAAVAHA